MFPLEPTVDAGGTLELGVATSLRRYSLRVERWTDRGTTVLDAGPFAGEDAPPGACDRPWSWPRVRIALPPDLPSGAYTVRVVDAPHAPGGPRPGTPDARWGSALFVVRRAPAARVLINLPLFTYAAYNVADVDGTLGAGEGACLYSGERTVTLRRPGGGTGGHPWDEANRDVYDPDSPRQTFAHWDRYALAWFAAAGIAVDVCTDLDLHRGDVALDRYALLCTFGHDEYWTREKRRAVETFVDAGGHAAFFGGNTCWFRVRYNEATASISRDGRWCDDEPESRLTGVSFRAGGGKWVGARPPTNYDVVAPDHPLLRAAGVRDAFGAACAVVGYECDGLDDDAGPDGVTVLARASLAHWNVADGSGEVPPGGHAAMVTLARGAGTIFNAGTADWARCLARCRQVGAITRAVIDASTRAR